MALTKVHNRMVDGSFASVKDYGAIGDGVADDTNAINDALANESSIFIPAGTYRTTGTLILERSSGSVHLLCDRNSIIDYEGTGVAFRVGGSGNSASDLGLDHSVIDGLHIESDTAETLLWINGGNVNFNTFNQLYLAGKFPLPSGITHCLLIEGFGCYHNVFDNCIFKNGTYNVSINYNWATSTENSSTNTANANRFTAPTFSYFGTMGLYIRGSIGNYFGGVEFEHGGTATYCVVLEKDGSGVLSSSNYISGRFEAGSTDEIYIKDGCINNFLETQVKYDVVYETAADEADNIQMRLGGQSLFHVRQIEMESFTNIGTDTLFWSGPNGNVNFSTSGISPTLAADGNYELGQEGGRWSTVWGEALSVKDGITAPSTSSGNAIIYVDSADGDLKIKFGDGTVKTIVTDT